MLASVAYGGVGVYDECGRLIPVDVFVKEPGLFIVAVVIGGRGKGCMTCCRCV